MTPLNPDQRREMINARQRFDAWRDVGAQMSAMRGSMVWSETKGREYLLRSTYDSPEGRRHQKSLGPRSPETERIKADFDRRRAELAERKDELKQVMTRQSAINRVLGLGRVPKIGASVIRYLDEAGWLGSSLRVVGTYALYAYEAAAGVFLAPDVSTTDDIDLLFDTRHEVRFVQGDGAELPSLLNILKRADRSFEKTRQPYRAANAQGYFVDLIKPLRDPAWRADRDRVSEDADDLSAVEIEGLVWLENASSFESVVIDEQGQPFRLVTIDPRVFVAHKHWLSQQPSRAAIQRVRDRAQASVVARLTAEFFPHLPYESAPLQMLPKAVFDAACPLFQP